MIDHHTRVKVAAILLNFRTAHTSVEGLNVTICALARAFGVEPSDSQPIAVDNPAIMQGPTIVTLVDATDEDCRS